MFENLPNCNRVSYSKGRLAFKYDGACYACFGCFDLMAFKVGDVNITWSHHVSNLVNANGPAAQQVLDLISTLILVN